MKTTENASPAEGKVLQLQLARLRLDGGTQSRAKLCNDTAERYAESLKGGAKFPPPVVFRGVDDRTPDNLTVYDWLAAGFHRWHAHDKNSRKTIECVVYQGSRRDAVLYSVSENHKHGLQRTNEDKRHAVRLLLEDEQWWERTNVWIADKCHVSDMLVRNVREEMEEEWRLEEEAAAKAAAQAAVQAQTSGSPQVTGGEKPSGKARGNRTRKGRNRHGGTRMIDVEKCATGKNAYKVRPVRVETETKQLAKVLAQIERSAMKLARQGLTAGWTEEEIVEKVREKVRMIPVED